MLPVDRIFIHHEGAGVPRDSFAFAAPYTAAIGKLDYHIVQSPLTDYSTMHFNHVSAGIVFSGNRMTWEITDNDLLLLTVCVRDLRLRNWVTVNPIVLPHKLAPGLTTGTVCPGDKTMAAWTDVYHAVELGLNGTPTPQPGEDVPMKLLVPDRKLLATDGQPEYVGKQPAVAAFEGTPVALLVHAEDVGKYGGISAFTPVPANFFATLDIRDKA